MTAINLFENCPDNPDNYLARKVDNLNPTDDRESREQSHGSTNSRKLCLQVSLFIFHNFVKSWCGKSMRYIQRLNLFLLEALNKF